MRCRNNERNDLQQNKESLANDNRFLQIMLSLQFILPALLLFGVYKASQSSTFLLNFFLMRAAAGDAF